MKYKSLILIALLNFSQLRAQTKKVSNIPEAKLETLYSDIIGEDIKLHITLPIDYTATGIKYPVYYYLDAWWHSGSTNELAYTRSVSKTIDPIILVGISYETQRTACVIDGT